MMSDLETFSNQLADEIIALMERRIQLALDGAISKNDEDSTTLAVACSLSLTVHTLCKILALTAIDERESSQHALLKQFSTQLTKHVADNISKYKRQLTSGK